MKIKNKNGQPKLADRRQVSAGCEAALYALIAACWARLTSGCRQHENIKPGFSGSQIALANSTDEFTDFIGLDNQLTLDSDGWALLAPFGEHHKERVITNAAGQIIRERYVQIVDEASVDAVVANEKGTNVFQKLKRALVKRPIYRDHPDLKLYAPETVAAGNDQLIPLGVNDGCRKTARGLEFRPLLAPEGAVAVENGACKYPSALFLLKKTGVVREDGAIEVRPFALASIGLTANPNISGVDSLANARTNTPAAKQTETQNTDENMKQLLIGWLAANNVVLANDSTDQVVWEKFLAEMATRGTNITSLANDKSTLTGTITSLTGDKAKLTAGATLPTDLVTAANRIVSLENAQADVTKLRRQFLEARVDLAITQGKAPVADREKEVTALLALGNDKLDGALADLDKRPVKFQVASGVDASRKPAADNSRSAHEQVISLANNDPRYKNITDFGVAFNAVLKDNPALAEQLRQKPTTEKNTAATT